MGTPHIDVLGMDHIVLRCADVATTLAWYTDVLGLAPLRVDEWRRGDVPFPSVRVSPDTVIDLFAGDPSGERLDHICLVVAEVDLRRMADDAGLHVLEGPVPRWGARGVGTSLYIRDPDGLVVELRHYGAPQPPTA
jgi:catechol 2,3-dioxygenase-like lactoylglutathione lyase family enzyme